MLCNSKDGDKVAGTLTASHLRDDIIYTSDKVTIISDKVTYSSDKDIVTSSNNTCESSKNTDELGKSTDELGKNTDELSKNTGESDEVALMSTKDTCNSDDQVVRLAACVTDKQYFKLFASHHNILPTTSCWLDNYSLSDRTGFLEHLITIPKLRAYTHGHIHQAMVQYCCSSYALATLASCRHLQSNNTSVTQTTMVATTKEQVADVITTPSDFYIFATPATSVQFKPASCDFAVDKIAPGYRVFELYPDGSYATWVERLINWDVTSLQEIAGY